MPNWLIINSDIRRLERICRGKVHDETDDLQALILEYDENFLVLHTAEQPKQANEAPKTKAVNPVVALWEQKGVSFPGKGILPNSKTSRTRERADQLLDADTDNSNGLSLLFEAATMIDDEQN